MHIEIYHNPRCSKSRATLQILNDQGVNPDIRKYLENPPTVDELKKILKMLKMNPRDLIRKGESEFKALGLDDQSLSDEALIKAMVNTPKLIERPIVITEGKAKIGRPPESVLDIL